MMNGMVSWLYQFCQSQDQWNPILISSIKVKPPILPTLVVPKECNELEKSNEKENIMYLS